MLVASLCPSQDVVKIPDVDLVQVFLAGCLGGAGQLVLACPVDLVKVRLQANKGIFDFRDILALVGWWHGKLRWEPFQEAC